jgi:hypothetical protein
MGEASDRIELTHELSGGRRVGRGFMVRCFTHRDSKASLHLTTALGSGGVQGLAQAKSPGRREWQPSEHNIAPLTR